MVAGKFEVSRKNARPKTGCSEYTHYSPKGQTWWLGAVRPAAMSQPEPYSPTQALAAVSVTGALLKMKR
jgi:hypothetical protein